MIDLPHPTLRDSASTEEAEGCNRGPRPTTSPGAALRSLAALLNNVGVILHERGELEPASQRYGEAVRARMEALREDKGSGPSGSEDKAAAVATRHRTVCEERDRLLAEPKPHSNWWAGLDMYPLAGSPGAAGCLPSPDPIQIRRDGGGNSTEISDSHESAVTLYNLGLIHMLRSSLTKAHRLFNMASTMALNQDDASLAASLQYGMAWANFKSGRFREAMENSSVGLELWAAASQRATENDSAGEERKSRKGMANILSLVGRIHICNCEDNNGPPMALGHIQEALTLRRSLHGDYSVEVASTLYSVGIVLRSLGQLGDAEERVRWFLSAVRSKIQSGAGPGSDGAEEAARLLAEGMYALGITLREGGKISEAAGALRRCVELRGGAPTHPGTVDALSALGEMCREAGDPAQSMEYYSRSVRVQRQICCHLRNGDGESLREGRDRLASVLCMLGRVYKEMGRLESALQVFGEVLGIARDLYGEADVAVANLLGVVGNVHLERGETEQAMIRFAEAARITQAATSRDDQGPIQGLVISSLLQNLGIEFHPHAPAA